MKKLLLFMGLFVMTLIQNAAAQTSEITVISPNGGETFTEGKVYSLTWKVDYVWPSNEEFNVYLVNSNNARGRLVAHYAPGFPNDIDNKTRTCNWKVPFGFTGSGKIRIEANGFRSDLSDNVFSIIPGTGIHLFSPNDQGLVEMQEYNITWDNSANIEKVDIAWRYNGINTVIASNVDASSGQYRWKLPYGLPNKIKFVVASSTDPTIADSSIVACTVIRNPIQVTYPKGFDTLAETSTHTITWVNDTSIKSVNIEFNFNGYKRLIASNVVAAPGEFTWTLPSDLPEMGIISIVSSTNATLASNNFGYFYVQQAQPPTPGITVLTPNLKDTLREGIKYIITWRIDDPTIEKVNIEWGGETTSRAGRVIDSNINAKAGRFEWVVPYYGASNANKIFIRSTTNPGIYDASDNSFIIQEAASLVTVLSPNGGELLQRGNSYSITWSHSPTSFFKAAIEYLSNTGAKRLIATNVDPSIGVYNWSIPADFPTGMGKIIIRSTDPLGHIDTSDNYFTIQPDITVVSPNGGETLQEGGYHTISWQRNNPAIEKVNIELSYNGTRRIIATDVAANASYRWFIPFHSPSLAKIIVRSATNPAIADSSDNVFSIQQTPELTLVSPNGGQTLQEGQPYVIRWQRNDTTINKVNLELSYSGGNRLIATDVEASTGQFTWNVPFNQPTPAKITIRSTANSSIADSSDNSFTFQPATLTLTSPTGGETFIAGTTQTIRWNTNLTGYVSIYQSIEGSIWVWLAEVPASANKYDWNVPFVEYNSTGKLAVSYNNDIYAVSNDFTIEPAITLASPQGGETFISGSTQTIKWKTSFTGTLALWYKLPGSSLVKIADVPATAQEYKWKVPAIINSTTCRIRLEDPLTGELAMSDDFTIRPAVLKVTSTSAANWQEGSNYTVRWEDNRFDLPYNFDLYYKNPRGNGFLWHRLKLSNGEWANGIAPNATGFNQASITLPAEILNCGDNVKAVVYVSRMANWDKVDFSVHSDSISVSDLSSCITMNRDASILFNSTTLAETKAAGVYPNPAGNKVDLFIKGLENTKNAQVWIYNASGVRIMYKQAVVAGSTLSTTLDVSKLEAGMYFISVKAGNTIKSLSFVKQ